MEGSGFRAVGFEEKALPYNLGLGAGFSHLRTRPLRQGLACFVFRNRLSEYLEAL